ncbi:MAG: DUF3090 family protein [Acidimicrobiales bacterium]
MSASFELPDADWVTVGAVGEPGQRTFYLQARQGDRVVTLKLEKQQVAALATLLGEILADLPAAGDPSAGEERLGLVEPVLAEWAVGAMQLAYDDVADRVILLAEEIVDPEIADAGDTASTAIGRVGLTRRHAAAIAAVGLDLVSAGRPPCPLCGRPIDPEGHACPRTNGHRQPTS